MITLHRLGHPDECFQLNPDLIVSVESTPDTVITLATTAKVIVADTPQEVTAAIRAWRTQILSGALEDGRRRYVQAPTRGLASRGLMALAGEAK